MTPAVTLPGSKPDRPRGRRPVGPRSLSTTASTSTRPSPASCPPRWSGLRRRAHPPGRPRHHHRRESAPLTRDAEPHTYTVLNAADVGDLQPGPRPGSPTPADLAAIPTPRLGVVGCTIPASTSMRSRPSRRAEPGWQIVLIGPMKPGQVDEARLRRQPNIHFLGEKPRPSCRAISKAWPSPSSPTKRANSPATSSPSSSSSIWQRACPWSWAALPELERFAGIIGVAGGPRGVPGVWCAQAMARRRARETGGPSRLGRREHLGPSGGGDIGAGRRALDRSAWRARHERDRRVRNDEDPASHYRRDPGQIGGTSTHIAMLARGLEELGHEARLVLSWAPRYRQLLRKAGLVWPAGGLNRLR